MPWRIRIWNLAAFALIGAVLCPSLSAATGSVLWERSSDGVIDRGVQIPKETFTGEHLIALSLRFLKDSSYGVAHLTVVSAGQNILFSQWSDNTYSSWAQNYKRHLARSVQVAELVSIGGNSVLRVRDGFATWKLVLSGRDPLIYRISGDTFEIVHIGLSKAIVYPFMVFASCSGHLTVTKAEEFYAELRKVLPTGPYVKIRKDHWFYNSLSFPEAYWYDLNEPPSEASAVLSAPNMHCYRGSTARGQCEFLSIE